MIMTTTDPRSNRIRELAAVIDSHAGWWRFPEDPPIRGFLGTDRIFLVGDQPSTSSWDSGNPNRRAFYTLLVRLGLSNAHLTDLYKRRGRSGELKGGLPPDFDIHLRLFREELELIRPERVVAMGQQAHALLHTCVPEVRPILTQMWHFAYAVRYGRVVEWEANARTAIDGRLALLPIPKPVSLPSPPHPVVRTASGRKRSQRDVMRGIYRSHHGDVDATIAAYAHAERDGEVVRSRNSSGLKPEEYARALLNDGLKKGWL